MGALRGELGANARADHRERIAVTKADREQRLGCRLDLAHFRDGAECGHEGMVMATHQLHKRGISWPLTGLRRSIDRRRARWALFCCGRARLLR
eukprot:5809402-Prymnesium_polylepis.1